MIAALPPVPWHLLGQVLASSAFFALSAVVLFSLAIRSVSIGRDSQRSGLVRATASTIVVIATVGIAYLGYLSYHFIVVK